jgi:hypothetical protein
MGSHECRERVHTRRISAQRSVGQPEGLDVMPPMRRDQKHVSRFDLRDRKRGDCLSEARELAPVGIEESHQVPIT